jgi:hypothetical protein
MLGAIQIVSDHFLADLFRIRSWAFGQKSFGPKYHSGMCFVFGAISFRHSESGHSKKERLELRKCKDLYKLLYSDYRK